MTFYTSQESSRNALTVQIVFMRHFFMVPIFQVDCMQKRRDSLTEGSRYVTLMCNSTELGAQVFMLSLSMHVVL